MHEDVNEICKEKIREYAHELSEKTIDTRLAKLHLEDCYDVDHPLRESVEIALINETEDSAVSDKTGKKEKKPTNGKASHTILLSNFRHSFEIATQLRHVLDATAEISRALDVDHAISSGIKQSCCVFRCERASIWIVNNRLKELWTHIEGPLKGKKVTMPWNRGPAGFARQHNSIVHVFNVKSDKRFHQKYVTQ